MSDSVIVPVYEVDDVKPGLFSVEVTPGFIAFCTRVQNVPHEFFGAWVASCANEPWTRVRIGVRKFLDLDARIAKSTTGAVSTPRTDWWPRQREIHFAEQPGIPADKLFGVISDDAWSSRPAASYCATARLTSKTKTWREPWEVPVSGGFVISGDLYSTAYARMDQGLPAAARYPTHLSLDESAQIADRQKRTLSLK